MLITSEVSEEQLEAIIKEVNEVVSKTIKYRHESLEEGYTQHTLEATFGDRGITSVNMVSSATNEKGCKTAAEVRQWFANVILTVRWWENGSLTTKEVSNDTSK